MAHGNGRHGFIFSRGCDGNVLRDNVAYDNRGHGFMIDDGRSEDSDYADAARLPSNDNQLIATTPTTTTAAASRSRRLGTVVRATCSNATIGIRVKNDASLVVEDNRVADSRLAGVDVLSAGDEAEVVGTTSPGVGERVGARRDVGPAQRQHPQRGSTPMVVAGEPQRDEGVTTAVAKVFRWNPLVLWAAILGIPTVLALHVARPHRGAGRSATPERNDSSKHPQHNDPQRNGPHRTAGPPVCSSSRPSWPPARPLTPDPRTT